MKEHIDEMTKVLVDYTKKKHIMASHVILEDYAEHLYNEGYRKQEWISVDDRLPEDVYGKERKKITVLVCSESGKVSTSSRQRRFKFNSTKLEWEELDTFTWSNGKRVTHWMPLPPPPKENKND